MKHKKHKVTFVRSAVLLACLTAGGAWAQSIDPWVCKDAMYVGRTTGTGTDETGLFTYLMDVWGTWSANAPEGNSNGSIDAGGTVPGKDLNALAYNPRDNYLYAMKRVTVAPDGSANSDSSGNRIGLYRIGSFGGIPFVIPFSPNNGAPYQKALRVQFVDTVGNALTSPINGAAATFDRHGNYFMVDGPRNKLYVVQGLHSVVAGSATQPDPGPQKAWQLKFENEEAANLPAGYTAGFATIPSGAKIITDFAVRQAESTGTQSVLYGLGDKMDGKWYLYRFRVTKPQDEVSATSGHAAYVSYREITGMNIGGYMASAAMSRDGRLFVYASGGKVFEINVETGDAGEAFTAVGAANSDGASCMTSILAAPDGEMAAPFKEGTNDASFQSDSVLDNDHSYLQEVKLDGTEKNAVLKPDTWERVAGPNNNALTLNTDPASPDVGKVTVAAGADPGDYVYRYEICVWPEVTPAGSACDKAEVFIKVNAPSAPTLDVQPDNYGTVGVGPDPLADSVVENDTVAGASAVLDGPGKNAQLKPGSWTKISGPATDKPSLDYANGKVTVPVGTPPGDYVYEYELCADAGAPCKKAQVTFKVVELLADNESFGVVNPGTTTTESIYTGDTVDGAPVVIGTTAELKPNSWAPKAPDSVPALPVGSTQTNQLTLNADGKVVVPSNAAPGDYTYNYTICLPTPNEAICDKAEVKLTVKSQPSLPSIDAKDDDWQATPLVAGKSTTGSIFTNDLVGSANVAIGTNANLKGDWQPDAGNPAGGQGKLSLKGDGTIEAAKDAPAGIYKFDYAICLTSSSTTCDLAKVTVKVEAAKIAALDDVFDNVAPGGATPSILTNDLVDGQQASLSADWELDVGSWLVVDHPPGAKALSLNNDGTVEVPSDTPEGTYWYRYRICRKAAPAECDWALFTLRLRGAAGAGAVTPVPVGAPWALGLAALGMLGVARRVRQRRK